MYALSDKYRIAPLKEYSRQRFDSWCRSRILGDQPLADYDQFAEIFRLGYETTPAKDRGLRDIVIQVTEKHCKLFFRNHQFGKMLEQVGQMGKDLAEALSKHECPAIKSEMW